MAEQTTPASEPAHKDDPTDLYSGALAEVAERHEEIRNEKSLELFVPGYENLIKVRYRLLPEVEMDRLGKRIEGVKASEGVSGAWKIEADSLANMCDCILLRVGEDYTVLDDGTGPVRFERRFAKILEKVGVKVDGEKATEIVVGFFSPRSDPDNPTSPRLHPNAMERHTNAILAWHRGEREKISRELLGE
jgi:hypothetical protein